MYVSWWCLVWLDSFNKERNPATEGWHWCQGMLTHSSVIHY